MKKSLAIVLCVLMLVSSLTVVSFAEQEEAPARVEITSGSTIDGWSNNSGADSGIAVPAINTEIDDEGKGAVAITLTGEVYPNGGYNNPAGKGTKPTNGLKLAYKAGEDKPKGINKYDLTGMNYIVFDLYLSDASVLSGKKMFFELTSAGSLDKKEICWEMSLDELKGDTLTDGWNHFEVALDSNNRTTDTEGPFDSTQWRMLRFYNGDGFDAGEGYIFAVKNVYFSSVSEAADRAKAQAQSIIEMYQAIEGIKAENITAENYETIKAQLAAAVEAYQAATVGVQAIVDEAVSTGKLERSVTRAIEAYEESLKQPAEDPEDPTDPVDPGTSDAPDQPDTPTDPTDPEPTDPEPTGPADPDPTGPEQPADEDEAGVKPIVIVVIAVVVLAVVAVIVIVATKKKK